MKSKAYTFFSYLLITSAILGVLMLLSAVSGKGETTGFFEAMVLLFVVAPLFIISVLGIIIIFLARKKQGYTPRQKNIFILAIVLSLCALGLMALDGIPQKQEQVQDGSDFNQSNSTPSRL